MIFFKGIIKNEFVLYMYIWSSGSGSIRRVVSVKENGFYFRFLIYIRGICIDIEMVIIGGTIVRRLKFLKIVLVVCDVYFSKGSVEDLYVFLCYFFLVFFLVRLKFL